MEAELQDVSSHTVRIKTTRKEVSLLSEDASACRTYLSMSSCSSSKLAMHERVNRKRKEIRISSKIASSRNAEQKVMLMLMEQFSGLPKSFVVVRNVDSIA